MAPVMPKPAPTDYWTFFAGEAKRGHSPLYERLALGIRDDDQLRSIAARVKPGQPQANLILAAAHYLLLEGADHPLADHYPSVRPRAKAAGDPVPLFHDFCIAHEASLLRLIENRVTNTNEVARSTSLYPAFDFVASETGEPLHLIEIGPSAGFNLNWDRYKYIYRGEEEAVVRGPSDAGLVLEAKMRGNEFPPLGENLPRVASRVGLELNPVDLSSAEDRLWLKALIWPELTARFRRLDAAIETARAHPARVVIGDALANLADVGSSTPRDGALVVYHSHVTYQFNEDMRRRLGEIIKSLALARPVYRVSIEWEGNSDYPIKVERYENSAPQARTIALCDPHGAWLDWRG
jgi:hypothetical protein